MKTIWSGRALIVLAAVSAAGFFIAVAILLQSSLALVADQATEIDDSRSQVAMQAALHLSEVHLADSVELNSVWDDAVVHAYAPSLDRAWLHSSYGALAKSEGDYDSIYIIESDGTILWGAAQQKADPARSVGAVASGLTPALIAQTRKPGSRPLAVMVATPKGPALAGIGLIQPSSGAVRLPAGRNRYLLLLRHIDAGFLRDYAQAYGVSQLALDINERQAVLERPNIPLRGVDNRIVGRLSWNSRAIGSASANEVAPRIRSSLGLLAVFCLIVMIAIIWGLRQLRRQDAKVNRVARTDPLTGLANRASFLHRLKSCEGHKCALALIDIDYFKALNDGYGATAGDAILRSLGERIAAVQSEHFIAGRLGGDVFGIFIFAESQDSDHDAWQSNMREAWLAPFDVNGCQIALTLTMGVAVSSVGDTADDLYRKATAALTYGKEFARSGVTKYDRAIDQEISDRLAIERQLHAALGADEFEVYYQPVVSACDQKMDSVEALVRWPRRPDGPLAPDVFIPIAERCGAIQALGLFVLRRACLDMLAFPNLKLSVNVSPVQLNDPRFQPAVEAILDQLAFPACRLELEVTEGYMIDLPVQAEQAIQSLKSLGISIALDDFGVGYSSIGYLRRFAFDKLKIDRSLAATVGSDAKASAVVVATIAIAKALDIPVTAEGVESADQAYLLRLAGCQHLQGYLFGRPVPIADFHIAFDAAADRKTALALKVGPAASISM